MLKTKSVYDAKSPEDGIRVLAAQYWPRGVRKEHVDLNRRALAPSRELLRSFKDGWIDWPAFREMYLAEMTSEPKAVEALEEVRRLLDGQTVTVMCVCRDEAQCHRSLIRGLLGE